MERFPNNVILKVNGKEKGGGMLNFRSIIIVVIYVVKVYVCSVRSR